MCEQESATERAIYLTARAKAKTKLFVFNVKAELTSARKRWGEMTERLYDNLRQFIAMLYYQNGQFVEGVRNLDQVGNEMQW